MNPSQENPEQTENITPVISSAEADAAALEAIQALESEEAALEQPVLSEPAPTEPVETPIAPETTLPTATPEPTPPPAEVPPTILETPIVSEPQPENSQPVPITPAAPPKQPSTVHFNPFESAQKDGTNRKTVLIVVLIVAVIGIVAYLAAEFLL